MYVLCVKVTKKFIIFVPSPLDELIDQLGGPGSVAEMTGRRGRVVRGKGNQVCYEQRDIGGSALESLNNTEVEDPLDHYTAHSILT